MHETFLSGSSRVVCNGGVITLFEFYESYKEKREYFIESSEGQIKLKKVVRSLEPKTMGLSVFRESEDHPAVDLFYCGDLTLLRVLKKVNLNPTDKDKDTPLRIKELGSAFLFRQGIRLREIILSEYEPDLQEEHGYRFEFDRPCAYMVNNLFVEFI